MKAFTLVISHLSCWPLGWAIAELVKPNGNLRMAAYCCLFAAVVALVGMWVHYCTRKD